MSEPIPSPWASTHKGDLRARLLADKHYTRGTPGHPMWTRPGYNFVLYAKYPQGEALFCWWRPKWEDGRPGTQRKDGLRVLECTMFRRVGETDLASELIVKAVSALNSPESRIALQLHYAGPVEGLITGISTEKTKRGRSKSNLPGHCYRMAGWTHLEKNPGRADVWLKHPWANWASQVVPPTQLDLFG